MTGPFKRVEVSLDGFSNEEIANPYFLFPALGQAALAFIEADPDGVRDKFVLPIYRFGNET